MMNLKTGKHFTDAPNAPLITRGGFLRGILASGIAPSITMGAIANAGSANASVGGAARGMMRGVGGRLAAMSGWTNPYITDGLVAMFDGEWNSGPWSHSSSITNWYDLSLNGHDITSTTELMCGQNYVIVNNRSGSSQIFNFSIDRGITVEAVVKKNTSTMNYSDIFLRWGVVTIAYTSNKGSLLLQSYKTLSKGDFFPCSIGNGTVLASHSAIIGSDLSRLFRLNNIVKPLGAGIHEFDTRIPESLSVGFDVKTSYNIYNMRFYSRSLSATEVSANYAIDKARFNLP